MRRFWGAMCSISRDFGDSARLPLVSRETGVLAPPSERGEITRFHVEQLPTKQGALTFKAPCFGTALVRPAVVWRADYLVKRQRVLTLTVMVVSPWLTGVGMDSSAAPIRAMAIMTRGCGAS